MNPNAPRVAGRDYMEAAETREDQVADDSISAVASAALSSDRPRATAATGTEPAPPTVSGSVPPPTTIAHAEAITPSDSTHPGIAGANRAAAAPPVRSSRARNAFVALSIRDFRYLFISTVSAGFGQWAQMIGMGWLVFEMTGHSVRQLAMVAALGGAVRLVSAPAVGVLLDRWNRRLVLVSSISAGAAQGALLAVLVITGLAEIWHIYVFVVIEAVLSTSDQIARQAFVYDVSTDETLPNAIALSATSHNVARIAGPPMAGAMIGLFGTGAAFIFLAATMTLAALLTLQISSRTRQGVADRSHPLRSLAEGLRYVWSDPVLRGLVIVHTIPAFLVFPYMTLLPVFAEDVLEAGSRGYGLLAAGAGWGSLVGLTALTLAGDVRRKGALVIGGILVYSTTLFGFTQSTVFWLSFGLLTFGGVFFSVAMALAQTILQTVARNDMRGRVTSVYQISGSLMALGALPMAMAVEQLGPARGVGSFVVVAAALIVLTVFVSPALRRA